MWSQIGNNSLLSLLMGQGSGPDNIAHHPMVNFYGPGDILPYFVPAYL